MSRLPKLYRTYLPAIALLALVFILNIFQLPSPDDWAQASEPGINDGLYYIGSRYFSTNSRIGEIYGRFFLYIFKTNIFREVVVFGMINAVLFALFILGIYRLIKGTNRIENGADLSLFGGIFFFIYISGHFNQSYIVQFGATTYFWTIFNALFFMFPYYRLLTEPKKAIALPYLRVCFFGLLAGWGSELIGPVIALGLGFVFLYLVFIRKKAPPLWFYAGAIMILVGWMLVFYGPGHRLRNTYNVQYYVPILQRHFLDILRTTAAWMGIYSAATLPLSIPSILALHHIKKHAPEEKILFYTILGFLLLGYTTAFLFALMLQWLLPPRAWIIFSFFFILSASFSYGYYLKSKPTPSWPRVISVILVILSVLHCIEIVKYRRALLPIYAEIEAQKAQGKTVVAVEAPLYSISDAFFLRWVDDLYTQAWVLDGVAQYYGLDNTVRIINPKTKEPYAPWPQKAP